MHLFNNLAKVILDLKSGSIGRPPKPAVAAASSSVSGKTYYWRGFVSDRGSVSRPAAHRGRGRGGRGGNSGPGRGDQQIGGHRGGGSGGSGRARPTPYQRSVPPRGGNGKIRFNNWTDLVGNRHFFTFSNYLLMSYLVEDVSTKLALNLSDSSKVLNPKQSAA
jgi:hypothetical protein